MLIDAHQHFWQWSRGWFSRPEPVLSRDYLPGDFEPILKAQGIDKTIVVQTSPTVAETDFLLELAEEFSFIDGVVGWLDLESTSFPESLQRYSRKRFFVAVRPMLESMSDDAWIVRPRVIESVRLIAQMGLGFEFLTLPRHLGYVLRLLERVPNLRGVIDHLSKPEIKKGKIQPWNQLIQEVALHPNIYCKLSGMVTEANPNDWTRDELRPYADHVLESFGPERVIFGSDWPVCLLGASYQEVLETARVFVSTKLGRNAIDKVFGLNAARFYRFDSVVSE